MSTSPERTFRKDNPSLYKKMLGDGWTFGRTKSNHLMARHPNGAILFHSGTPGDRRGIKNFEARVNRAMRKEGV